MERGKIYLSLIVIISFLFSCQTIKNSKSSGTNSSLGHEIGDWRGKLNDNTPIRLSLYRDGNALLYRNNKLVDPFKNKKRIVYYIDYNSNPVELTVVFMREEGTSEAMLFYIEFLSRELLKVFTNFDYVRVSEVEDIKNIFLLRRY